MNQIAGYEAAANPRSLEPVGPRGATLEALPMPNREGPEESILRHYWRIVLKRRKLIGGTLIVAALLGIASALMTKAMYASTATIEIAREVANVVDLGGESQQRPANDPEFYQTQYSLLQSRSLAERVVDKLRLDRDEAFLTNYGDTAPEDLPQTREARRELATGIVMANTEIVPVRLSSIVNVRFNSPDPQTAAKVANALTQNFIESTLERRYDASSYARTFLQQRLDEIRQRLEDSERQAVTYAGQNELIDISPTTSGPDAASQPQQSLVGATLAEANSALAKARADRIAAENRYRRAAGQPVEALTNNALNDLRSERAQLASQYQKLLSDFGPQYPTARAAKAQLDELDRQISNESGRIGSTVSGSLRAEYEAARANEAQLAGLVERLKGGVIDQRRRSIQYNIFQRDVDTNRALYDALLQRYKEIGIAGGVGTNNVSIVDAATVPNSPYSPNILLNLVLSLLAGAVIGAGLALIMEHLEDAAVMPDEFENKLGIPLLGTTPKIGAEDEPLELLADPKTPMSEAYFSALTGLRFSTSHGTPRSVVVTSSQASEGKTTTSYALAANLARVGGKVLLLDADMRNPSVHKFNNIKNEGGTSNLLIGEGTLEQLRHPSTTPGLDLMAAGPIPPNPAELLAGPGFEQLLANALKLYDHVVIDAPPVLGLADAPLLARVAEGTVFVMESRRTKASQARIAVRRLLAVNATIIGAVLTKLDHESTGYGYGYGYDYDYGHSRDKSEKKGRLISLRA